MAGQVRYCMTEDGVRIAYSVEGQGPAILILPPLLESFALDHLYPAFEAYVARLSEGRTSIRIDWRGSGLSQRDVKEMTPAAYARDLRAVVEATGTGNITIYAPVIGIMTAAVYLQTHSRQISALVIYGAVVRSALDEEGVASLAGMARSNWHWAAQALSSTRGGAVGDASQQHTTLLESSISGANMATAIEHWTSTWDAAPLLAKIDVPTLVVHRLGDTDVPFANAQEIAAAIPGARLAPLQGSVNFPGLGDTDSVTEAIDQFLDGMPATARVQAIEARVAQGPMKTVLFTDIVGHTEMMSRLGDVKGREVLREHERITREVLAAHGGAEVKTMGDGFMASFGSVTSAVECAIGLQRAFGAWNDGDRAQQAAPLLVRVGLNAGEPIEEDGDLFGAAVILASRIATKAGAGEILVPDTVRGLLSGKGFVFGDRGEFVPKGFDEGVRVWEVKWTMDG